MRTTTNWTLILAGYASLFVFGFLDNTRGPYFPDITNDLSLTDTQASLFFAVASLVSVISGRLVPWFLTKMRLINMMRLGLSCLSLSCLGYSFSQSLPQLLLYTSVFGFGFGVINVGQNLLVLDGSSHVRRRQLISGLHSTYAFAAIMAPLVVGFLTDNGWSWRQGFQAFALVGLLGFAATLLAREDGVEKLRVDPLDFVGWRVWLPFGLVLSLYVASEVVLVTRFVLLSRRAFEATEAEAVLRLAGFFALLLAGRLSFTFFSFQKWSNRRVIFASLLASVVSFTLGLAFSHWFLILCGLTMAPCFGVAVDYMASQFGKDSDRVISMVLAFSGLFIVAIHWFVGILSDLYGIQNAMYSGPLMLMAAALFLWWLPSNRKQREC